MDQARFWIVTCPKPDWTIPAELPPGITWIKGQEETGANTGYEHWQFVVAFKRAVRLAAVKKAISNTCHAEPTRSSAANDYVCKAETAVPDSGFELGY